MPAKGQRRRQQIIETAKDMFLEYGFQSSHIGQVCDKLNIARGTVYQYFGNKREILYAILDDVEEQINDTFDPDDLQDYLKSGPIKDSLAQFLHERFISCVKTLISEPIVIKLIFKEIHGIDDEVRDRIQKFIDNVSKIIINDIEQIKLQGFYRKNVNADVVSKIVIGGVLFIVQDCEIKGRDPLSKEIIISFVDSILNGIS